MKKRIIAIIVAVGALLLATGVPAETQSAPVVVKIDNFSFTPQKLTVHKGTRVIWVNMDDLPHTVTSEDKKFKSRVLDTDERFTYTFKASGTYSYHCSVHPHMTGKVIVQ